LLLTELIWRCVLGLIDVENHWTATVGVYIVTYCYVYWQWLKVVRIGYWFYLLHLQSQQFTITLNKFSNGYVHFYSKHWTRALSNNYWNTVEVKIKVILRPTTDCQSASRPVCLGVRHPSGTRNQLFLLFLKSIFDSFGFVDVDRLSWRDVGS
jgi:hypothetical protein